MRYTYQEDEPDCPTQCFSRPRLFMKNDRRVLNAGIALCGICIEHEAYTLMLHKSTIMWGMC